VNVYAWVIFVVGQKKLGKVITPDPWKAGARNTTGESDIQVRMVCRWQWCSSIVGHSWQDRL